MSRIGIALSSGDTGHRDLAQALVGQADDRDLPHGRVLQQQAVQVKRARRGADGVRRRSPSRPAWRARKVFRSNDFN